MTSTPLQLTDQEQAVALKYLASLSSSLNSRLETLSPAEEMPRAYLEWEIQHLESLIRKIGEHTPTPQLVQSAKNDEGITKT